MISGTWYTFQSCDDGQATRNTVEGSFSLAAVAGSVNIVGYEYERAHVEHVIDSQSMIYYYEGP